MNDIKQMVKRFMVQNHMDFESIDIMKECEVFLDDMQGGLDGYPDCMDMLPTYIPMNDEIRINEPVIVMDAGGTNFRVAVVYFDSNRRPVIENYASHPMPGIEEETSREEFLNAIVEYLKPVINRSNKIGLCFSYPTEILPSGDGRLIRFSKEIKVQDMTGRLIGAEILEALRKAGYTEPKQIVLLNDTVAALLGGKAAYGDRRYDSYVGFILGTGTNTCYIEKTENIGKIHDKDKCFDTMLINMETGDYNRFPSGSFDLEFDRSTYNPGKAGFEKKTSGAYLGGLILVLLKNAAREELLSGAFLDSIQNADSLSTIEVNRFLNKPYGENILSNACSKKQGEGQRDRITLYYLIDSIVERAARLIAVNLISVVIKSGKGQDPCRPVCITADGSTFYKLKGFRSKLEHYMKVYLVDKLNLYYEFVEADNANLTGTAIAALTRLS